jgi:hypothetical protein
MMFSLLHIVTALLTAITMALALAHVLELCCDHERRKGP